LLTALESRVGHTSKQFEHDLVLMQVGVPMCFSLFATSGCFKRLGE
jgi:hypothetical protein